MRVVLRSRNFSRSSQSGFALMELVVATGISAMLAVGFGYTMVFAFQQQKNVNNSANILAVRSQALQLALDEQAIQNTITSGLSSTFACLSDVTTCQPNQRVKMITADGAGPIDFVDDPTSGTHAGMRTDGTTCQSASSNPDEDCPIRMKVSWNPICDSPCTNPQIVWNVATDVYRTPATDVPVLRDKGLSFTFRTNYSIPTIPGSLTAVYETCSLLADGRVKCWGQNVDGSLGYSANQAAANTDSGTPKYVLTTGDVPLSNVTQIVDAKGTLCALLANGQVTCWGRNYYGQLGTGILPRHPSYDFSDPGVAGAATGHPVNDASVLRAGRIVQNETNTGPLTNVTKLTSGRMSVCAVVGADQIYCWGRNGDGPNAVTALKNTVVPNRVAEWMELSGFPNPWLGAPRPYASFYALPQLWAGTPTGSDFKFFDADNENLCLVFGPQSMLTCWGARAYGKLGNDESGAWGTPRGEAFDINRLIPAVGIPWQPYGTPVLPANALQDVKMVDMGNDSSCAVLNSGEVVCWGSADRGQLGRGGPTMSLIGEATDYVVDTSGSGRLSNIQSVQMGDQFACGLSTGDELYCWGRNNVGQTGDGTNTDRSVPFKVSLPDKISNYAVGTQHVCTTLKNKEVWCWGCDANGSLGQGTTGGHSVVPLKVLGL